MKDFVKKTKNLLSKILNLAYDGASTTSDVLRNFIPKPYDQDTIISRDLQYLRSRSQDLYRNAPIATGAIHTKINNIVGTGLKLQSRLDREKLSWLSSDDADLLERQIESEWNMWSGSPDCDLERISNFSQIQEIAARTCFVSGDVFAVLPGVVLKTSPYRLKIQLIDPDRVCNPTGVRDSKSMVMGVERDQYGVPLAYHIRSTHPGSQLTREQKWIRYLAFGAKTGRRSALHLHRPLFPGQSRGFPELAPVITLVKQLTRYTDTEVSAAVVSAFFAVFIKTPTGTGMNGPVGVPGTTQPNQDQSITMDGVNILNLQDGEDISTASPGRPNAAFEKFVEAVLQQIGVALELPFEILRAHFSSSYSASRAALLEAQKAFRSRRQWMADSFCQPIYEAWFDEAVALGRIVAPGYLDGDYAVRSAYLGSEWVGPSFGNIDPLKEVKAAQLRIDVGLSTIASESAAMGSDFDVNHVQRAKEVKMRREAGLEGELQQPDPMSEDIQNMLDDALNEINK